MARQWNVIDLGRGDLDASTRCLSRAFAAYPMIRYFLDPLPASARRALCEQMFRGTALRRLAMGWPWLGVRADGELAGVACVSTPQSKPDTPELVEDGEDFARRAGEEVMERIVQYSTWCEQNADPPDTWELTVLGTDPDFQGRGIGKALLAEVHRRAAQARGIVSVSLTTQSPRNVALYERAGYEVTAHGWIGGEVESWAMLRRNADRGEVTGEPPSPR